MCSVVVGVGGGLGGGVPQVEDPTSATNSLLPTEDRVQWQPTLKPPGV